MRIILASASPRRKELLRQIGLEFEIQVSQVEEVITQTQPGKVVEELSSQKARAVVDALDEEEYKEGVLVIGADTVVAADGEILGKPKDESEAVKMLHFLSGRSHEVFTGVTLFYKKQGRERIIKSFHERTAVVFYPMGDDEIAEYVATRDCMDKAGAYGIQGGAALFCDAMAGDYYNVMGLPVCRLGQVLRKLVPEEMEEAL